MNKREIPGKDLDFFLFIVSEAISNLTGDHVHLLWMFSFSSYKHDAEENCQNIFSLEKNNLLWSTFYWFHTKLFKSGGKKGFP